MVKISRFAGLCGYGFVEVVALVVHCGVAVVVWILMGLRWVFDFNGGWCFTFSFLGYWW